MFRVAIVVFALCLPVFWLGSQAGMAAEDLERAVVKIRAGVDDGDGDLTWQTGSGFLLRAEKNRHLIVTVTHVVKGADKILIEYRGQAGKSSPAKVLRMEGSDPNGIALLTVNGTAPATARMSELAKKANKLDPVRAVGFPRGGAAWNVTTGTISGFDGRSIAFSAPVDSGNSGGPLFDRFGRVVGVVTSTRGKTGFATRATFIEEILRGWDVNVTAAVAVPTQGVTLPETRRKFPGVDLRGILPARNGGFLVYGGEKNMGVALRLNRRGRRMTRESLPGTLLVDSGIRLRNDRYLLFGMQSIYFLDESGQRIFDKIKLPLPVGNVYVDASPVQLKNGQVIFKGRGNKTTTVVQLAPDEPRLIQAVRYKDIYYDLIRTTSGGTVFVGEQPVKRGPAAKPDHQAVILQFAADNKLVREWSYGAEGIDVARHVIPAADDAYIVGIELATFGNGKPEARIIKLNREGEIWNRELSYPGITRILFHDLWPLKNGDMIAVTSETMRNANTPERKFTGLHLINSAGHLLWSRKIAKTGGSRPFINGALELPDGDVLLVGMINQASGNEGFLVRMNRNGEFLKL